MTSNEEDRIRGDVSRGEQQRSLRPHDDRLNAGQRPWHVEVGYDGGLTAVVDIEGHLVCDCEPAGPPYETGHRFEISAAGANAKLICEAVNREAKYNALLRLVQKLAIEGLYDGPYHWRHRARSVILTHGLPCDGREHWGTVKHDPAEEPATDGKDNPTKS